MKIELKILGLSYSQASIGSYILVLSEVSGQRKLPIIIKATDAQYIGLKIEGIKGQRPLTQDLIKSITESLDADISEVYIYNLVEGIFYSKFILFNGINDFEVECSVGDAVSVSLLYGCPIMVESSVMDSSSIYMEDSGEITDDQLEKNKKERKDSITIEDLSKMLENAVENEEYEVATQIRDRIKELSKKN